MGYLLQNGGLGMAGDWIITGGRPLQGRVEVPAAKNSVLPLLAAALLCSGPVRLQNVPRLTDVEDCLALLRGVGCTAGWQGAALAVQGQPMRTDLAPEAAGRMRASILFCAPLLAKLGRAETNLPGGCRIGARPIDLHLAGLRQMGAVEWDAGPGRLVLTAPSGLHGAEITLRFPSVGATETLLMAAAAARGETVLRGAAVEPEVTDLARFLQGAGADITGVGTRVLHIRGRELLMGTQHAVCPDRITAATVLCAVAGCGGEVLLTNTCNAHLAEVLRILRRAGCMVSASGDSSVALASSGALRAAGGWDTGVYPSFPTDAAPLMAAALLRGDVAGAFYYNPFTLLLGTGCALWLLWLGARTFRKRWSPPRLPTDSRWWLLIPCLVGAFWVARNLPVYQRFFF